MEGKPRINSFTVNYTTCPTCIPLYPAPPNKSGKCLNLVSMAASTLPLFRLFLNYIVI